MEKLVPFGNMLLKEDGLCGTVPSQMASSWEPHLSFLSIVKKFGSSSEKQPLAVQENLKDEGGLDSTPFLFTTYVFISES